MMHTPAPIMVQTETSGHKGKKGKKHRKGMMKHDQMASYGKSGGRHAGHEAHLPPGMRAAPTVVRYNVSSSCEKKGGRGKKVKYSGDSGNSSKRNKVSAGGKSSIGNSYQQESQGIQTIIEQRQPVLDSNGKPGDTTEFLIKLVGTPKEFDQIASSSRDGNLHLFLDNNCVSANHTTTLRMHDRIKSILEGGNGLSFEKQPGSAGGKNSSSSQQQRNDSDDSHEGAGEGSIIPESMKKQEKDLVHQVTVVSKKSEFPHDIELNMENLVIPGHFNPHSSNKGLTHVIHAGENTSTPVIIGKGMITSAVAQYHKRYPTYGSIEDMEREEVVHQDTNKKVKVLHSAEFPHPVVDYWISNEKAQYEKAVQEHKAAMAARNGANSNSSANRRGGRNGRNNNNNGFEMEDLPEYKSSISLSRDDQNMVVMPKKVFKKALKELKRDPQLAVNMASLSDVAAPSITVIPSHTRGDITNLGKVASTATTKNGSSAPTSTASASSRDSDNKRSSYSQPESSSKSKSSSHQRHHVTNNLLNFDNNTSSSAQKGNSSEDDQAKSSSKSSSSWLTAANGNNNKMTAHMIVRIESIPASMASEWYPAPKNQMTTSS
jgi:hypothetical protein